MIEESEDELNKNISEGINGLLESIEKNANGTSMSLQKKTGSGFTTIFILK